MMINNYIDFSDEVKKAMDEHTPIVAIETGGTFEGIPYPENAETALKVMDEVRAAGATPAYISIIDGRVKVGMSDEEVYVYAKMRGTMQKASRREIPQIIVQGKNGVMTIAATMVFADYVGILVVSGGGIGGVHRGAGKAKEKTYMILPVKEYNGKEIRDVRMKAGMTQSSNTVAMAAAIGDGVTEAGKTSVFLLK